MNVDASSGAAVLVFVLAFIVWFMGGAKNHKELKKNQKKGKNR